MISSGLIPTRRAVIDINRPCNAKCRMCYYTYDQSDWSKPFDQVQQELRQALERGNTSVDFTGGEPTIYPQMAEVIRYAESIGLHTCIISNGLAFEKVKKLAEAGCSEWLLSVHGYEEQQDKLLNVKGAWEKTNRSARFLNDSGCLVRVNCTLTRYNFEDLPKLARHYDEEIKPRIINFINFNPHYEWGKHEQPEIVRRLNEVQVKASEVAPYLKQALDYLDGRNYWVNVRYFPLCMLKGYEKHVCNNPQVMFDPYEWDYNVAPKTVETYLAYGREFQRRINTRKGTCASCGMIDVCGGLHANYAHLHGFSELEPYAEQSDYPYFFKSDLAADIVVPAYKPNENLRNLLAEIAEKTLPPYNLIVMARQQSAAKNRNEGLRASRNSYVIMCDDDIIGLPFGWNRDLIYTLKANSEVLAASARLMTADGKVGRNTANNRDLGPPIVPVDFIPTACCIFRKTDVTFDERYIRAGWEDTDFFMQLSRKYSGKPAIANTVRVVHLNEEKNGGGVANDFNRDLFLSKWFPEEYAEEQRKKATPQSAENESAMAELQALYHAVLRNRNDIAGLKALINASYGLRRFDLLEACLKELLKTHSQAKELRYLLASCLFEQAKYEEALPVAEELALSHPDYAAAQSLLGQIRAINTSSGPMIEEEAVCTPSCLPVENRDKFEKDKAILDQPHNGANGSVKEFLPGPVARRKILLGPGLYDPHGNDAYFVKALKKAADVITFDENNESFEKVLTGLPSGWTPDFILIRDAEWFGIPPGLEKAESPIFCLLGDYNLSFHRMLPVMGAFDHFFCDLKGVRIFRKLGFENCEYFCLYGFDPDVHKDYGLQKQWDLLFVGNLNPRVQQERDEMIHRLASLRSKYRVHIDTNIFGADYARMLSGAHLVFNRPIRNEANMRFFEALGCGAMVLNPHLEELDMLGFTPGEHYLAYEEPEDTIEEYFERWPESKRRQARGSVLDVLGGHSYDARARELLDKISAIEVDTSRRPFLQLSDKEVGRRWKLHHLEKLDVPGFGQADRFDPKLIGWQTQLVNNELEIRNFDFTMWSWWMFLLASSGADSYLVRFLHEKEQLLESFGCHREAADQISEWKKKVLWTGYRGNFTARHAC